MALLSTGIIENAPLSGVRPSTNLAVRITNDGTDPATVLIEGLYVDGTDKTLYVQELISISVGEVVTRNYFAQFDAFEFQFTTSSNTVVISAWGKNAQNSLTLPQRFVAKEMAPQ